MSGITGCIDWHKDLTQHPLIIDGMTETLTSRGPDGSGTWMASHCAFGHRHLHISDRNEAQPLSVTIRGQHVVIVYNGALYNAKQLRSDLHSKGYSFTSHSDAEVILTAYIEWGRACLQQLNGMFAFAIWNREKEALFLARDRLGIKPLFYAIQGETLTFGSEPKAILAHPEFKAEINREGLAELFAISPARTPGHGLFRYMHELIPGSYLYYDRSGVRTETYWQLESKTHTDSLQATANTIRTLLQDTVSRQLDADAPIGTLLSGGLDSSILTALAQEEYRARTNKQLPTFSVDYVDNAAYFKKSDFQPNSDQQWIELMVSYLHTTHHNITIDIPELIAALDPAMVARDYPGMADVDASLFLFSCEIKKTATVVLSGEAADEIFGGYPWFYREDALQARTFPWSLAIKERASLLSPEFNDWIQPEQYAAERYEEACEEVPHLPGEDHEQRRMREMLYLNITRFAPTLLDRKERMTMRAGLEARLPFTDHHLIEYVWNIPWQMKYYEQREKGILRHAFQGILPDEVLFRKKSPYPKTHHPLYEVAVKERLTQIINDPSAPLLSFINKDKMQTLLQSENSQFPWFGQLMTGPQMFAYFIQMNAWLDRYRITIVH